MNRFSVVFASLIAGISISSAVSAADFNVNGDVGIDSQNVYRGQVLSKDINYNGRLRFDNVFVDGLFGEVSASTLSTNPINETSARTEVNVGWHGEWDNGLGLEVSVARVFNSSIDYNSVHDYHLYNSFNYNEARAKLSYQLSPTFKVYGLVGQGFNNPDFHRSYLTDGRFNADSLDYLVRGQNTYAAVGAETLIGTNLTVGALASANHYDGLGKTRYNNSEIYASLNVWKGLDVEGRYSFGGTNVVDSDIANVGYFGVRYHF